MRYNYYSPFKVGDEVIHDMTERYMIKGTPKVYGSALLVTITAETATRYKAGNLEFDKPVNENYSPSGRGKTRGNLRAITPELMVQVERTIREANTALANTEFKKACVESDKAEYAAWIETDEGRAMDALQDDYIGAELKIEEVRATSFGRVTNVNIIGLGRVMDKVTITQDTLTVHDPEYREILNRAEIAFSSNRLSSGQATQYIEMIQKAADIAKIWDVDAGKEWVRSDQTDGGFYMAQEPIQTILDQVAGEMK